MGTGLGKSGNLSHCDELIVGRGDGFPRTMTQALRLLAIGLLASCAAALLDARATAEPLDREACQSLESERKDLLTKEVQAALARGPDWVKDHLHSPQDIEMVRQYLLVEEKIKFRCRTDGVVIPKPKPVPLPDRKPPVPTYVVEGQKVLAGAVATSFLPLRKPSLSSPETANAESDQEPADEAGEIATSGDVDEVTTSGEPDSGPSQTIADSDKTAPSETKATQ
jgi:hypothetical protein